MKEIIKKYNSLGIYFSLTESNKIRLKAEKGIINQEIKNEILKIKKELIFYLIGNKKKLTYLNISKVEFQKSYKLSSSQMRLWVLSQYDGGNFAYNMPGVFELFGELNIDLFEKSFTSLIERHESLRTVFKEDEVGKIEQWILTKKDLGFKLDYYDLRRLKGKKEKVEELVRKEIGKEFDLSKGPLLRAMLIQTTEKKYFFTFVMHHIISDGWSMNILVRDLLGFYEHYVNSKELTLPVLPIQYKDYSVWQQQELEGQNLLNHKSYWLEQFSGKIPVLNMPLDNPRPVIQNFKGAIQTGIINKELTKRLKELCKETGSTLFMGLLGLVNTLLYKYTNQTDIIIGSSIAGRDHFDLQNQIGFYVNALALRTKFNDSISFKELLNLIKENTLKAFEHRIYPFDELVGELGLQRDIGRNPLFDVMMVLQNNEEIIVEKDIKNLTLKGYSSEDVYNTSLFDLSFEFIETEEEIYYNISYRTTIFKEETIQRLNAHVVSLLESCIYNIEEPINTLTYLSKKEELNLLHDFNNTQADCPRDSTIIDLFGIQVKKNPNNIALLYDDDNITYKELNKRSNQVARFLLNRIGLKQEEKVGLIMHPGVNAIISMIGILKAGGVYIPIEPSLPEDRIKFIIQDTKAKIMIIERSSIELLNRLQWTTDLDSYLCIDSDNVFEELDFEKDLTIHKELWDYVGEKSVDQITGGGWISSYTGNPFSIKEMQEYSQNIYIKLSQKLKPNMRVLEIGCSSGLTLLEIAPMVKFYYGTDLSSVILSKTLSIVKEKKMTNVKLKTISADNILSIEEKEFDFIIINSVIQNFPNHNYLRNVIKDCISLLKNKGKIFIGDIMNINKKESLIDDLKLFKSKNKGKGYTTKTDFSDLFISPLFFKDLKVDLKGISNVELSDKIFTIENELTKFRYDAIININKTLLYSEEIKQKNQFSKVDIGFESHNSNLNGPKINIEPSNLAYIIYTSGTTGKPKGVMITHQNLNHYIQYVIERYCKIESNICFPLFTSLSFDLTVTSIFTPISVGGIIKIKRNIKDVKVLLNEILLDESINILKITPAHINLMDIKKSNISRVIVGGDQLMLFQVEKLRAINPNIVIYNEYGPTETTVGVIEKEIKKTDNNIYIGKPIKNSQVYILGDKEELLPIGVVGEICIGGNGVARGYLNRADLTAEKFVNNPFKEGERIYKTGDLGKWLADGNIDFVGRKDDQVKIKGYRIELGEIENILSEKEGVDQVLVLAKDVTEIDKQLVAYIISKEELTINDLRNYLKSKLPYYMVPSYFVQIEEIPLTPNGKIDKKRLPNPEGIVISTGIEYVAPKNELQKKLVTIWSEVLKIDKEKIGIYDNFFALGGDSIKSIQISSKLRLLNLALSIKDILENSILENQSTKIRTNTVSISQESVYGELPLGAIQKTFLYDNNIDKHHYNQSVILKSRVSLNTDFLNRIFRKILEHHDALRMVFRKEGETWIQFNKLEENTFEVEEYNLTNSSNLIKDMNKLANKAKSSFDLSVGPLIKVCLFKTTDGDQVLIVIHHLVVDGVSWRIIIEDIIQLYTQIIKGIELSLPLKSHSFKYWTNKVLSYSNSPKTKERNYWEGLSNNNLNLLPLDYPKGKNKLKDIESKSFFLDKKYTKKLLRDINTVYNTEINDILVASLVLALNKNFGFRQTAILMEGHGRENIIENVNITRTVGWYTSTYPVLFDLSYKDIISQLIEVKDSLRRIPYKGIGYDIFKNLSEKKLNSNIEPQISFNYLGEFGVDLKDNTDSPIFDLSDNFGEDISVKRNSPHILHISGIQLKDSITMSISYSKNQFKEKTIARLLKSFKDNLKNLITVLSSEKEVFKTSGDFLYKNLTQKELYKLQKTYSESITNVYELSPMQMGLYYHWLLDDLSTSYIEQTSYKVTGAIQVDTLKRSFKSLVNRYEILRTSFSKEYGKLLQIVLTDVKVDFRYLDISTKKEKELSITEYLEKDRTEGFNLNYGALMRLSLLKLTSNTYQIVWTYHHILTDGWCLGILNRDFFEFYYSYLNNKKIELKQTTPYSKYISWLKEREEELSKYYWKNYLLGYEIVNTLPKLIKSEGDIKSYKKEINFTLSSNQTDEIKQINSSLGITLNILLKTIWGIVLSRHSNSTDVVFGSVVSGRPSEIEGIEKMVGLFINTIPIRIKYLEEETLRDLLLKVNAESITSLSHHYMSLADIQSLSTVKNELIDHIMNFKNFPFDKNLKDDFEKDNRLGFTLDEIEVFKKTSYDLEITVFEEGKLSMDFCFNENVYDERFMKYVIDNFKSALLKLPKNIDLQIYKMNLSKNKSYDELNLEENF